jgi:hypothetical protein
MLDPDNAKCVNNIFRAVRIGASVFMIGFFIMCIVSIIGIMIPHYPNSLSHFDNLLQNLSKNHN